MNRLVVFLFFIGLLERSAQAACVDGTDNVVVLTDCTGGQPISFTDAKVYVYTSGGAPSCHSSGVGVVEFPGQLKIKSISATISKPMRFEGTRLKLTFEKNTFPKIELCEDGVSKFPGVPDKYCNLDLCAIPGLESFCQQLDDKTGPITLQIDKTFTLPKVPDFLAPIINGNFKLAGALFNSTTSETVGCGHDDKVYAHGA